MSIKAASIQEAWEIAGGMVDGDYSKDENRSQRAGYPIYATREHYEYICDLGCRLEVNKKDGSSINIWIEKQYDTKIMKRVYTEGQIVLFETKELAEKFIKFQELCGKIASLNHFSWEVKIEK